MESDIKQKQIYLQNQIIKGGYDPELFMEFLVTKNTQFGSDLSLWKMPDLIRIVAQFKEANEKPENKVIKTSQVEVADIPIVPSGQIGIIDDTNYIANLRCLTKQPNRISEIDLKIKITKFEKQEGGVFERSFVTYTIEIPALKIAINRRYSDFVWFRQLLTVIVPGIPIPPITKKGNFKRYEDKYLIKKMLILQKFLNTITQIKQIKSDIVFQKFLVISDPKQFQKFKSAYSKITPVAIAKSNVLGGIVTVGINNQINNKMVKYQQYIKSTQPEIKKIYKNFKGAATMLEGASGFLTAVASNCKVVRVKQEGIRTDLGLPPIGSSSPYAVLQLMSNQYSNILLAQAKTYRKEIYSLMKYESMYKLNILQTMDQLSLKQQEYINLKTNLMKKKQKLYSEGKIDKWGLQTKIANKPASKEECFQIMLPKQTRQLMNIRENYALSNYKIFQECLRHMNQANRTVSLYLKEFIDAQSKLAGRSMQMWGEVVANMDNLVDFYIQTVT